MEQNSRKTLDAEECERKTFEASVKAETLELEKQALEVKKREEDEKRALLAKLPKLPRWKKQGEAYRDRIRARGARVKAAKKRNRASRAGGSKYKRRRKGGVDMLLNNKRTVKQTRIDKEVADKKAAAIVQARRAAHRQAVKTTKKVTEGQNDLYFATHGEIKDDKIITVEYIEEQLPEDEVALAALEEKREAEKKELDRIREMQAKQATLAHLEEHLQKQLMERKKTENFERKEREVKDELANGS